MPKLLPLNRKIITKVQEQYYEQVGKKRPL